MKKNTLLFFVLFAFAFYSCDQQNDVDSLESTQLEFDEILSKKPAVKDFESILDDSSIDYCGEPVECAFIAGQHIDAGSVTVSNDEDYLYVKVYSKAGFQDVSENIKMWIGLEAPSRRPPSGHFPYKVTETGDTHIFKIELSTLPEWDECGKQYDIIVHGDVLTEEGNSGSGETAYGGCELTGDKPWWAYMEYTTECCEEEEEFIDAFGRKGWTSPSQYAYCLSDEINNKIYAGWSNKFTIGYLQAATDGLYGFTSMKLVGGIDAECSNGVEIGLVEVSLTEVGDIKIQYKSGAGYNINKVNLYVGTERVPFNEDGSLKPGIKETNFYSEDFSTAVAASGNIIINWITTDAEVYIIAYAQVEKN